MGRDRLIATGVPATVLAALIWAMPAPAAGAEAGAGAGAAVGRGTYLATIMDCGGCHSGGVLAGTPDPARIMAGSKVGFKVPGVGVVYPPNLTPDIETGLGSWSPDEIVRAVREGTRPDGRQLAPVMPWQSYNMLSDEDAQALAAYLQSLPPVTFKAPGPFKEGETPTAPYVTIVVPKK